MTNYFVDIDNGDDLDDGTTMDDGPGDGSPGAWATLGKALLTVSTPGDIIWVRRTHTETLGATLQVTNSGTAENPYRVVGWPRAEDATADEATWTNDSTTVDLVTTLSMDAEKHCSRYVTAPNGETYMITKVVDANTFLIDRKYNGGTVTATDGAFTVQEDDDYDLAQAIGAEFATEKVAWTADADDVAVVDADGTGNYIYFNSDRWWTWDNIHFIAGTSYILRVRYTRGGWLRGCIVEATANLYPIILDGTYTSFYRTIFFGTAAGAAQNGMYLAQSHAYIEDVAIYGTGDHGLVVAFGSVTYKGLNIGIEAVTPNDPDINISNHGWMRGRDLRLGANVAELERNTASTHCQNVYIFSENHNGVLGAHKTFNAQGEILKLDVVAGSGDPYKRSSGADSVLELIYNLSNTTENIVSPQPEFASVVFEHEFEATTDSRRYRYYVNSEKAVLASELWIEVEYVSAYDDATEYVIKKVNSDEGITIRGDATDWSQYIEVEGIQPAVGSTVRIKCYCSFYDATDKIYIDPLCEVTT
jgi:hypothetical protein